MHDVRTAVARVDVGQAPESWAATRFAASISSRTEDAGALHLGREQHDDEMAVRPVTHEIQARAQLHGAGVREPRPVRQLMKIMSAIHENPLSPRGARGKDVPVAASAAQSQTRSCEMKWETPQAIDFRFGMEITMYIANR